MVMATASLLTEELVKQFHKNGYLILRQFFTPEEIDEIRETFMAQNADGPVPGLSEISANYAPSDPLSFYPRMMHPHRHPELPVGPLSLRCMLDARIESVLRALFDDEPVAAQSMFYFKPPGARGQDLHQDNYYLRVKPGTCIAAWLAVDKADPENGGLVVVPGSSTLDIVCPERADPSVFFTTDHVSVPEGLEEVPLTLEAGDMLFFNGSLIHGSYPNQSERFRRAFICHYVPAASAEVSRGYRPLLRFNGEEVAMNDATGGGPCGVPHENLAPH
ncbi:MAG TPA: phytanoyl-CoA dioxygenase family protein [Chthonomonadaceae bacterium]|nr:phytanoyl-CoA dioxygenase family protein [Chthonomonadaceae bacterium]